MLESVRGNIKALTKTQVTIKDKDGELKINSKGMRASICTQFLIIQANASVNFRSRNLEAYQDVEDGDVGKTKTATPKRNRHAHQQAPRSVFSSGLFSAQLLHGLQWLAALTW